MNTVKYLVEKGADINIKDGHGVGVLDYSCEIDYLKTRAC